MPKASFDSADMYSPSGRGFIETVGTKKPGEITNAICRYTQFAASKTTGAQLEPLTVVVLSIVPLDAAGARVGEPVDQELIVEFGPKDGSLIRLRPGNGDTANDDPADTAEEGNLVLGTEGNMIFVEEGVKPNMKLPFGTFAGSCKDKGFKTTVLQQGFLPDFVGTKAVFTSIPASSGKKKADGTPQTDFVVDSFIQYPYEKAASKPATAAKGAKAKPVAAAPAAPAATAPPATKVNGVAHAPAIPADADLSAVAAELVKVVIKATKSDGSPVVGNDTPRNAIVVRAIQMALAPNSGIDKSQHKALTEQLKDREWFETNSVDFGVYISGEDKYSTA